MMKLNDYFEKAFPFVKQYYLRVVQVHHYKNNISHSTFQSAKKLIRPTCFCQQNHQHQRLLMFNKHVIEAFFSSDRSFCLYTRLNQNYITNLLYTFYARFRALSSFFFKQKAFALHHFAKAFDLLFVAFCINGIPKSETSHLEYTSWKSMLKVKLLTNPKQLVYWIQIGRQVGLFHQQQICYN